MPTEVQNKDQAPKTLWASNLIAAIQEAVDEFGDLPVYVSDGKGELPLNVGIRFSNRLAFKRKYDDDLKTFEGKFYIISSL